MVSLSCPPPHHNYITILRRRRKLCIHLLLCWHDLRARWPLYVTVIGLKERRVLLDLGVKAAPSAPVALEVTLLGVPVAIAMSNTGSEEQAEE